MHKFLKNLRDNRSGATAIEYGLIAAFVSLAMVVALPTIKTNLGAKFNEVGSQLATPTV
ncbi:Flp family type IVb pilin [Sphingosinicella humi]|uniref:Flp family type IVb pilin n=1 Tax=Allosphingosinicella humi TaxID=2068657 RepID=A0A2U2J633_9SPHN|nr:Flp family type IVb pilin [Sphingosinicella humi]PWG03741.1 Flp family type IVb pilin [Sphingosinicella humi]